MLSTRFTPVRVLIVMMLAHFISTIPICAQVMDTPAAEETDIIDFYPTADSIASYLPLERKLTVVQQKRISGFYVSFIGYKDDRKIFIAAVTKKSIANPQKEISRVVKFDGVRPTVGAVSTWGYVFDRNGDGRIDYMALVSGATAFEDSDVRVDDLPYRDQKLDRWQLETFVARCRLIFNHWADDNYDGTLDAVALADIDPYRDWVKRRLVIRSTKFNGTLDDAWSFRYGITSERDSAERTNKGISYFPLGGGESWFTMKNFEQKDAVLKLLNRAITECGIKKQQLSAR